MRQLLQALREALGLGGSATEFTALHPNRQEEAARCVSVLEDLMNTDYWELLGTIGYTKASRLSKWYWASHQNDELRQANMEAMELDVPMTHGWLVTSNAEVNGSYWKQDETDEGYMLLTVASRTSARVAVALVRLTADKASGWQDWNTASGVVVRICDDLDEASRFVVEACQARRNLWKVQQTAREIARREASVAWVGEEADF